MVNSGNKVVELFPRGKGSVLRTELSRVADRIDESVTDLRDELSVDDKQRLGHRLDDLGDIVIFLRALAGA